MQRLIVWLAAWAATSGAAAQPVHTTPALGLAASAVQPADLQKPFETPLPLLLKTAGEPQRVEAVHCADWLKHRAAVIGSDNDAAWRVVRFQTVPCEAMALLQNARPASQSALPSRLGSALATAPYPASLWPAPSADAAKRLLAPGMDLARASGSPRWKASPDDTLRLSTSRWRLSLTLLARADFNGDGWEDAAFLWQAEAIQGSYADSRLVVLTRLGAQTPWTALDVSALLAAATVVPPFSSQASSPGKPQSR